MMWLTIQHKLQCKHMFSFPANPAPRERESAIREARGRKPLPVPCGKAAIAWANAGSAEATAATLVPGGVHGLSEGNF